MPRDRRPEFKSQVRINGRVIGLKKGRSKDNFMDFRNEIMDLIVNGAVIGIPMSNVAMRTALRADGQIIAKSHQNTNYEEFELREKACNH